MKPSILLVDDDDGVQFGFGKYLGKKGYSFVSAASLQEARAIVSSERVDAVLLDLKLPDGSGSDWIPALRAERPDVAIVVITGSADVPSAVEAMRQGADNFLTKPVNLPDLELFLRNSLELKTFRRKQLTEERTREKQEPFIGSSEPWHELRALTSMAVTNDAPVLLLGETGTGKGVLAQWIHDHGPQSRTAFVDINCSALGGDLLASELFGHAKGAFTSAVQDRQGLIEIANGGTLFLDEIGDMDLGVQAKLLKTLEEKRFRRVGEVRTRVSEFRLICATNRDLSADVQAGRFRQDLYHRISVFPIRLPALHECMSDLPALMAHLLKGLNRPDAVIPEPVMALFRSYAWPGNIRELKNVFERALLLAQGGPLSLKHFPGLGAPGPRESPGTVQPREWDLKDTEDRHIRNALRHFDGDMTKTAKALGISRSTLYRKLEA